MAQTDGLLTPDEVADKLRTSGGTVRRWARDGEIAHVKLPGGRILIPVDEVERLLTPTARSTAAEPLLDAG